MLGGKFSAVIHRIGDEMDVRTEPLGNHRSESEWRGTVFVFTVSNGEEIGQKPGADGDVKPC